MCIGVLCKHMQTSTVMVHWLKQCLLPNFIKRKHFEDPTMTTTVYIALLFITANKIWNIGRASARRHFWLFWHVTPPCVWFTRNRYPASVSPMVGNFTRSISKRHNNWAVSNGFMILFNTAQNRMVCVCMCCEVVGSERLSIQQDVNTCYRNILIIYPSPHAVGTLFAARCH